MAKRKRAASAGGARRSKRLEQMAKPTNEVYSIDHPGQASLLGAPAEIRNRIYELSLIEQKGEDEDKVLYIHEGQNDTEPGLLRTCRQIRNEARDIFFSNNKFDLEITEFKLSPQRQHWFWKGVPMCQALSTFHGFCVWDNFLEWLEHYHAGSVCEVRNAFGWVIELYNTCGGYDEALTPCVNAFEIVKAQRRRPWSKVKETLEIFRRAMQEVKQWDMSVGGSGLFV